MPASPLLDGHYLVSAKHSRTIWARVFQFFPPCSGLDLMALLAVAAGKEKQQKKRKKFPPRFMTAANIFLSEGVIG